MSTILIPIMNFDSVNFIISYPLDYIAINRSSETDSLHLIIKEDIGTIHEFPLSSSEYLTFKVVVTGEHPEIIHSWMLDTVSLPEHHIRYIYDRNRFPNSSLEPTFDSRLEGLGLSVIGADDVRITYARFAPIIRPSDFISFKLLSEESDNWLEIACSMQMPENI